jgi:lipopolysaccharide transport protein LptA
MALFIPDRRQRGLRTALAAAGTLLCLLPAHAAGDNRETTEWQVVLGLNTNIDDNAGTLSTEKLELRQGSTLLRASKAAASGMAAGNVRNSTWVLTGEVHIEFDGAVLDAQMATVVLADGRMKSLQVQPAQGQPPQPQKSPVHLEFKSAVLDVQTATVAFADGRMKTVKAQGSPAQFSHQLKNSTRRHGHADRLEYDESTCLMNLNGDVLYSSGSGELKAKEVAYNLCNGSARIPGTSSGTIQSDVRVPAPRTPDRATAK